jgi:anti-sigma regulatory factor (Ser/Thr protein kinase)
LLYILTFLLLALWSIAIILVFMRSEESTNLWFSGLFLVMGLGKVVAILENFIIPDYWNNSRIALDISRYIGTLSLRFLPYFLLMASVSYSEFFNRRWKKKLKYWFIMPLIIASALDCAFIKEILAVGLPKSGVYWATYIWIVPYYLFSSFLFYRAYDKEVDPSKKQQKLVVFIVLALPTLMIMVNNLTTALRKDWWKYTIVQNFIVLGAFIYFIGKYGFDGLRIRLRREYENGKISGVTFIGHAVKNELAAIHCNIMAAKKGFVAIEDSLQNIDQAACHLSAIIDRIGNHIQEFVLKCESHNLSKIINTVLSSLENSFRTKNIQFMTSYLTDPAVYCDQIHISETLKNILINAIDAIENNTGKIDIELSSTETEAKIRVSDNGVGIPPKELDKVTDLFYSTKENSQFRGSGLYYCASVIKRHNGKLKISSEPNFGTTVEITLPLESIEIARAF